MGALGLLKFGRRSTEEKRLVDEAYDFIELFHQENDGGLSGPLGWRMNEIEEEVAASGTYAHTLQELEFGSRVAWRNSVRCIGRLYWKGLEVVDARDAQTPTEMFDRIVDYLRRATNGGRIRPTILIFPPADAEGVGPRIWNDQIIRYAGYPQEDGSVLGDPSQVGMTQVLRALGWEGGAGTPFDVLPLAIQVPGQPPELFELPSDAVLEVEIEHPENSDFSDLGLRWHAVPAISNMRLEIGGVSFTAAPFNGWYMGTEVGARNLADSQRYDQLPRVAELFGLDTQTEKTLWRDRALVELNRAVLYSYARDGVAMVDHHTVSAHHVRFEERESQCGREVRGRWDWLVPPMSGSTTPVFHRRYDEEEQRPNFFTQPPPWAGEGAAELLLSACPMG